ncbi:MAG: tetratricopeptide repeat protein [Ignavibacteriales bacterium]|jgi:tetratricopeptide (TPR) repeat protein|nr:tetratricopeptide repeat protein [Ignavibacteriales bacterium]MBK8662074.1 tetratricopeptide repeat protein [Ignavibacteriales bacterium]MBP7542339.1 tetratricopeptide repeat protein [Ignavibacteriaceae bacterium]MBP9122620.1 tetratricopeptide repeat protein [Ignavibacteriaceae bacterium]
MSDIQRNNYDLGNDDFSESYLEEIIERCRLILSEDLREESIVYIDNSIEILLDNYRYEEVLDIVKRLISVNPFDYENYYRAGFCLFRMNEPALAYRSLTKALTLNPNDSSALIEKAMVCIQLNRLKEATGYLKAAYEIDKEDPRTYFSFGIIFKRLKKYNKSIKFLKKASTLDPEDPEILFLLAHCYRDVNNQTFAMDTIEKYLELEPKCSDGWFFKGQMLERLSRIESALNAFATSMAIDPLNLAAVFSFVELNIGLRKYKIATESLNSALNLHPENFAIYFKLGEISLLKQDYFTAAEQFTKAIEADKKFAGAYLERAFCQLKLGEFALALQDFRDGLLYSTREGKTLWGPFGKWGFHLGDDDREYIAHFEEILKIDDKSHLTWLQLAEIKLDYRNPHHALLCLYNALSAKPLDGRSFYLLARIAYKLGNNKQGLVYLRAAFKRDSEIFAAFRKKNPLLFYSRVFQSLFGDLMEK